MMTPAPAATVAPHEYHYRSCYYGERDFGGCTIRMDEKTHRLIVRLDADPSQKWNLLPTPEPTKR